MTPATPTRLRGFDKLLQSVAEEDQPIQVPTLERYWRDPAFAERHDIERAKWQRQTNALIDEGIRKARQRRADAEAKECGHD